MSWGAIGGAVVGVAANKMMGGDRDQESSVSKIPQWSPYQLPYLWEGDPAEIGMPQMNAETMNYYQALMAGGNPRYGMQMGQMPGMLGMQGGPGGSSGGGMPEVPWFMNNQGSVFEPGQQGGMDALLGFGQGAPPPLFTNDPYYSGQGVRNPEDLKSGVGTVADPNRGTGGTQPEAPAGPAGMTGAVYVRLPDGSIGVQLPNGNYLQPEEAAAMARAGLLGDIGMPEDQHTQAMVRRFATPGTGLEQVMAPKGGGVLDFFAQQKQMQAQAPDWGSYSG